MLPSIGLTVSTTTFSFCCIIIYFMALIQVRRGSSGRTFVIAAAGFLTGRIIRIAQPTALIKALNSELVELLFKAFP